MKTKAGESEDGVGEQRGEASSTAKPPGLCVIPTLQWGTIGLRESGDLCKPPHDRSGWGGGSKEGTGDKERSVWDVTHEGGNH